MGQSKLFCHPLQNYHLEGMRLQLRQLRAAFGLAVALNRTLVMPKVRPSGLTGPYGLGGGGGVR